MESVKAGKINIPVIKGDTGETGQIDSVSVEMIGTNEEPRVDNLGTKTNAKLNFYIPKGTSIEGLSIDEFGDLNATLSNGQTIDCGRAKGEKGDKGDPASVEEYGIFYWDGKSSTDNPENIELWQKIIDLAITKTVMVIIGDSSTTEPCFFCIDSTNVNTLKSGGNVCSNPVNFNNDISRQGYYSSHDLKYTSIQIENETVIGVNAVNSNSINSNKFLPTDTNYVTDYTPTHNYHPATKKYVDDSITNSLSSISGLTPQIVDTLPSTSEASSNIIYLVPDEEATENDLYIEYLFINGNYEQIGKTSVAGADLSEYAKKDEVPLVYFWDGKNSTENPNNIQFFQEIVDKHLAGKNILIVQYYGSATYVYNFLKGITGNKYNLYSNLIPSSSISSSTTNITAIKRVIEIYMTNSIVTSISSTFNSTNITSVLSTTNNSENYFTPTKAAQPVSKGYLDEVVGNINSILDNINGEVIGTEEVATLQDDILVENDISDNVDFENEEVTPDVNE